MSTKEYIDKLNANIATIKAGQLIGIAAQDTHTLFLERVFEKGLNKQEKEIGEYDKKDPLYVNPKNSPRNFPPKGKQGDAKFEDGKPHKTGYFSSYSDYRRAVGRQSDKVDFTLFGNLKSDISSAVVKVDEATYVTRVSRKKDAEIIEGLDKKYGKVFALSDNERGHFKDTLTFEILQLLQ